MKVTVIGLAWGIVLAGCTAVFQLPAPEVRVENLPPDNADIIEALLRSGEIPLSVHPLCEELAGARAKTIGGYVAELLAMQEKGGSNSVWVGTGDGYVDGFWEVNAVFSSGTQGERNHWGVQFLIRKSGGLVMSESFRCTVPAWD